MPNETHKANVFTNKWVIFSYSFISHIIYLVIYTLSLSESLMLDVFFFSRQLLFPG